MIDTTYTVIYTATGSSVPHTHKVLTEEEAIRFAASIPTSRIRRDTDNAYYDKASGQWIRIAGSQITCY